MGIPPGKLKPELIFAASSRDLSAEDKEALAHDHTAAGLLSNHLDLAQDFLDVVIENCTSVREGKVMRSHRIGPLLTTKNEGVRTSTICVRTGYATESLALAPFPRIVLELLNEPSSFDDLVMRISRELPTEKSDIESLLEQQLTAMRAAGLISHLFPESSAREAEYARA